MQGLLRGQLPTEQALLLVQGWVQHTSSSSAFVSADGLRVRQQYMHLCTFDRHALWLSKLTVADWQEPACHARAR